MYIHVVCICVCMCVSYPRVSAAPGPRMRLRIERAQRWTEGQAGRFWGVLERLIFFFQIHPRAENRHGRKPKVKPIKCKSNYKISAYEAYNK